MAVVYTLPLLSVEVDVDVDDDLTASMSELMSSMRSFNFSPISLISIPSSSEAAFGSAPTGLALGIGASPG